MDGSVNWRAYGIPQGTPISAVLSNIFMIDFDLCINKLAKDIGAGLLRVNLGLGSLIQRVTLAIANAIEKAGHILEFLPAYSPDLNPIEQKWAQVKSIRKQKYYQIDELFKIESFYVA